jgi:hypothetical protein
VSRTGIGSSLQTRPSHYLMQYVACRSYDNVVVGSSGNAALAQCGHSPPHTFQPSRKRLASTVASIKATSSDAARSPLMCRPCESAARTSRHGLKMHGPSAYLREQGSGGEGEGGGDGGGGLGGGRGRRW